MLKIENVEVYGWEAAIRGMRNPLNSWDRSDSAICHGADGFEDCKINAAGECPRHEDFRHDIFCIGENDFDLMKRLADGGSTHAKYRRMITVTLDITAPLYWWKEFDTYKVGTVANSCSTMHKIHAKEFTREDFSTEHLGCLQAGSGAYWDTEEYFEEWITLLNVCREAFIKTNHKTWWWQMIQLLPTSYNQRRTVLLNYEVLTAIYHDRRKHKLDEWHVVCDWIEGLPHSEIITG